MYLIDYYKQNGTWHVDAQGLTPPNKSINTARTGNFAILLDRVSRGTDMVSIYLDFKPFPKSSQAGMTRNVEGEGAYYHIGKFGSEVIDLEIWVDRMPFLGSAPMPETLYIRVIDPA
jgi:hypothetical protein